MSAPARSQRLVAYACLALSMSLVGSYVALSKPLLAALPVFLLAWLRFGLGGLAIAHWFKKPADEAPITRRTQMLLFLESFLGNFLFSICMLYGMRLSSAVAAGVIMAAIPAAVALLSWFFLGERMSARVWVAVACAALGVALLSWAKAAPEASLAFGPGPSTATAGDFWGAVEQRTLWGHGLLFAAVLCEAAYAVIGKQLSSVLSPKRITALINLWGFVLMTPMGLYLAWQFDFSAVPLPLWGLLVFYALAASVWTVWLWMTGLKHVPASQAGVFTVMLPIAATVVGVVALGERATAMQGLALTIALFGLLLATLPTRARSAIRPFESPHP